MTKFECAFNYNYTVILVVKTTTMFEFCMIPVSYVRAKISLQ